MDIQILSVVTNNLPLTQQISNLVKIIQTKCGEKQPLCKIQEYEQLLRFSLNEDPILSEIAALGLLKLVENSNVKINDLIKEYMTLIPSRKINLGMVQLFGSLLVSEKNELTASEYNLYSPQHPYIKFLLIDPKSIEYICNEITLKWGKSSNLWIDQNKSIFYFILCHPFDDKLKWYQLKLWETLLENKKWSLISDILLWMPVCNKNYLLVTELMNVLQSHYLKHGNLNGEIILLLQVNLLHILIMEHAEPRSVLENISLLLSNVKLTFSTNLILFTFSKLILHSSLTHMNKILEICDLLITQRDVSLIILQALKAALLLWIGNPNVLATEIIKKAGEMITYIEKKKFCYSSSGNKKQNYEHNIFISNKEMFFSYQICNYIMFFEKNQSSEKLIDFLNHIKIYGNLFINEIFLFVSALFISDLKDHEVNKIAFEIICQCYNNCETLVNYILTLILFKLSDSNDAALKFLMLKFVPKMVNSNRTVSKKILTIINVLCSGSDIMKMFGMQLIYELWSINNTKWYPYLERIFNSQLETKLSHKWNFFICKANIISQICKKNSTVYGKEIVPHISKIINQSLEDNHKTAAIICLDTITLLCQEEVIDIKTTWNALVPKFSRDDNVLVIKSFCRLIASISVIHKEKHKEVKKDAVQKLWKYILDNKNYKVKEAALNALINFDLVDICEDFPDQYLENKDVISGCSNSLVPGSAWLKFLQDEIDDKEHKNLIRGDFLIKLISNEVDDYTQSVYQVHSSKEPLNYNYLPIHSVLRGVAEYVRIQTAQTTKPKCMPLIRECLRILSQSYSKPLPPYNWSFLSGELSTHFLKYTIDIASHQVIISGTARRYIEEFIKLKVTQYDNEEEVMVIYKNIKFLANSIQPLTFKPFFENTLRYAISLYKNSENKTYLSRIVNDLKVMIADADIQKSNKQIIFDIIKQFIASIDFEKESGLLEEILQLVLEFPIEYLNELCALPPLNEGSRIITTTEYFENFEDTSEYKVIKEIIQLRCRFATNLKTRSLNWLNEILNVENCNYYRYKHKEQHFLNVFINQTDMKENARWFMELLGRTEAAVTEKLNIYTIQGLVNTIINSLVIFSGLYIFLKPSDSIEYCSIFPQAAVALFKSSEWISYSGQALEYFYYFNQNLKASEFEIYINTFGLAIQASRNHPDYQKNDKWIKFLNSFVKSKTILEFNK